MGLLFALCLALLSCGKPRKENDVFRVGLLVRQLHIETQQAIRAVQLRVDRINAAGGLETVEGQLIPVELTIRQDFSTPEQAVAAMRELIHQEKVAAVIGPLLSRNAIPAAEVAESVGVPMISPGSTHPATTLGKKWVFRTTILDDVQGREMAQFALEDLDSSTAAALYDVSEPFSRSVGEIFQMAFKEAGGQVVAVETYTHGEKNFAPQLERIRQQNPAVLFLPNPNTETIPQAQLARSIGLDATILGCDVWDIVETLQVPELDGSFAFQHWHPELATIQPATALFVRAFQERYGEGPSDAAALAWDAAGLIFAAAHFGRNSEMIRNHLASMRDFRGATGTITFAGHGGNPPKSAVIVRLENGRLTLGKQVLAENKRPQPLGPGAP